MQSILYGLLFLFSAASAAQLPGGEYSTRQPIGSVMFILNDSSQQFYWVADDCNMGITGRGKWEQTRNKITFNFLPILQPAVIKKQPVFDKKINDDGIFSAAVQLADAGDSTIKPAGLYIRQTGTKNGAITDSTGQAVLQIQGAQATLYISGAGYKSDTIILNEPGHWSVKVYLEPAKPVFVKEGKIEYRIAAKNKDYVELQPFDKKADLRINRFYYRKQTNQQTKAYLRHWISVSL